MMTTFVRKSLPATDFPFEEKEEVAQEFLDHANEEQGHADIAAQWITRLGRLAAYRGIRIWPQMTWYASTSL